MSGSLSEMRHGNFTGEPDFKRNPVRAVWRRVLWRLHWRAFPERPVVVKDWWRGMQISLPRSGSAAHIYYRTLSSAAKVRTLTEQLGDGMIAFDIGAHIGEYTLIMAALVRASGHVYAFEPQKNLAKTIRGNAAANRLDNITVFESAVGSGCGEVPFSSNPGSMAGWIVANAQTAARAETVSCVSVDQFVAGNSLTQLDFIKLDAAGNEVAALQGAAGTLSRMSPTIMCQLYHPQVVRERHGCRPEQIPEILKDHGYDLWLMNEGDADWKRHFDSPRELTACCESGHEYAVHYLLATKKK